MWETRFDPWVRKIPWRRKWQPTAVFLPGKSHGLRFLVGYSPWGRKESDTTERLHLHFSLFFSLCLECPFGASPPFSKAQFKCHLLWEAFLPPLSGFQISLPETQSQETDFTLQCSRCLTETKFSKKSI